jgi:poly(3-hydroxybutyrate) depolymerase
VTLGTKTARISTALAAAAALLALVAATPTPPAATPPSADAATQARLQKVRAQVVEHAQEVTARGASPADLLARIDADLSAIAHPDADMPAADRDALDLVAQLDASLAEQLVSGSYGVPSDQPGATELVVRSSADTSAQPLALYLPTSYNPKRSAPLILMLHAQGQTESELLAVPYLRALADQTGAIFAVPFARGDKGFDSATVSDVYDALTMLRSGLNVDRRRVYLAGVSLGGFVLFMVAPLHPEQWSALLAIGGSLTNEDKQSVVRAMAGKQVFLVIGADDPSIKAQYVQGAADYLLANGVESRLYEQPRGVHSLQSLQPSVERAWRDMLAGMRNVAPDADIPSPQPAASRRT